MAAIKRYELENVKEYLNKQVSNVVELNDNKIQQEKGGHKGLIFNFRFRSPKPLSRPWSELL